MNRTALLRKAPLRQSTELAEKCCAQCRRRFIPARPMQAVCSPRCATRKAEAAVKARKAAERAQDRERRQKLKRVSQHEAECRAIMQRIARIRDRNDGCISCHLPSTWGGQWHGSHFRSVGACSALQFHLWNIHKACSSCNRDKGGNIINYRPRLIQKMGQDRVDWLMAQNAVTKRTGPAYVAYLQRFKRVMGKRARRMEKAAKAGT